MARLMNLERVQEILPGPANRASRKASVVTDAIVGSIAARIAVAG